MKKSILVTGATGYIGGRLVPRLLEAGYTVRCMVRDESRLRGHSWTNKVDVTEGDALEPQQLLSAMQEVSTAYYLIHGMQGGSIEPERDIQAARNFAAMAKRAGVDHIIYLGELADQKGKLSPYLRSRHEVGENLRNGKVPVTEFQSGMTVGSGSVLFEMVRYTAEIQPVFICPKWWFSDPMTQVSFETFCWSDLNCLFKRAFCLILL